MWILLHVVHGSSGNYSVKATYSGFLTIGIIDTIVDPFHKKYNSAYLRVSCFDAGVGKYTISFTGGISYIYDCTGSRYFNFIGDPDFKMILKTQMIGTKSPNFSYEYKNTVSWDCQLDPDCSAGVCIGTTCYECRDDSQCLGKCCQNECRCSNNQVCCGTGCCGIGELCCSGTCRTCTDDQECSGAYCKTKLGKPCLNNFDCSSNFCQTVCKLGGNCVKSGETLIGTSSLLSDVNDQCDRPLITFHRYSKTFCTGVKIFCAILKDCIKPSPTYNMIMNCTIHNSSYAIQSGRLFFSKSICSQGLSYTEFSDDFRYSSAFYSDILNQKALGLTINEYIFKDTYGAHSPVAPESMILHSSPNSVEMRTCEVSIVLYDQGCIGFDNIGDVKDSLLTNKQRIIYRYHVSFNESVSVRITTTRGTYQFTPNHYVFVNDCSPSNTRQARELTVKDRLCGDDGSGITILDIEITKHNRWFNIKTYTSDFTHRGLLMSHHTGYHISGFLNRVYNWLFYEQEYIGV